MKHLSILAVLLAGAMSAVAQTSLPATPAVPAIPASPGGVIPGVDGKTICESSTHVLSICPTFQVTYTAEGVLTVGGVPVNTLSMTGSLILVGGTAYQDGNYLVKMTSGAQTFTPYTVPASNTFTAYTVTVPQAAAGAVQVGIYKPTTLFTAAAQVISTTPVLAGAPSTDITLGHTFAQTAIYNGSIYVTVWNYGKQANPQQNWTVLVSGK